MLCSKCFEKIPEGEEIKVENSVGCKQCVQSGKLIKKEVIAKCHKCPKTIYNGEKIHEFSLNVNSPSRESFWTWVLNHIFRFNDSEKVIYCGECYQRKENKAKRRKKRLERKKIDWPLTFFCFLLVTSIFIFFNPKFVKRMFDEPAYLTIIIVSFFVAFFSMILIVLISSSSLKLKENKPQKTKKQAKKKKCS